MSKRYCPRKTRQKKYAEARVIQNRMGVGFGLYHVLHVTQKKQLLI